MFLRLLVLFTLVPLVELFLLIQVGRVIGLWPTIGIVIATGALGAWLARFQGLRVLWTIRENLAQGTMPTTALLDGALILAAGAVLLTPGLITDAIGFFLLIPAGRALVRKLLVDAFHRHLRRGGPTTIDAQWRQE
jgi:UPF0716 protein FxsA